MHKDLVLNAEDDEYITTWQMEDVEKMTEAVCKRVKREIQKKKMIKNIEAMLEKRNGRKIKFSELDEKTKNAVLEAYAKTMEEYTNKSSD